MHRLDRVRAFLLAINGIGRVFPKGQGVAAPADHQDLVAIAHPFAGADVDLVPNEFGDGFEPPCAGDLDAVHGPVAGTPQEEQRILRRRAPVTDAERADVGERHGRVVVFRAFVVPGFLAPHFVLPWRVGIDDREGRAGHRAGRDRSLRRDPLRHLDTLLARIGHVAGADRLRLGDDLAFGFQQRVADGAVVEFEQFRAGAHRDATVADGLVEFFDTAFADTLGGMQCAFGDREARGDFAHGFGLGLHMCRPVL